MANYFMRSADGTKMYRIEYEVTTDPAGVAVGSIHFTGDAVTLPSGAVVSGIDGDVAEREVLVDVVTGAVTVSDVAAYRALAKSISDAQIDARW